MSTIKKIFFVSYLKNKGIRRICFILGILFAITPAYLWYEDLKDNFYNETYENIIDFGKENKYNNTDKQKEVYNELPEGYHIVYTPKQNNVSENNMTQEISISKANYLYLLKLLWSLFWFYLPFLLSCIIKWVYTGFKEK